MVTKPGYMSTMRNFAINQKTKEWVLLEFSYLGFIGELRTHSPVPTPSSHHPISDRFTIELVSP